MEFARGERRKVAFALLALEDLIGEAEIGANEFVGEHFARRCVGKHSVQAERAAEDRFVIADAPLAKLGLDAGGRVLDQHSCETLETDAAGKGVLIALGEFETLLNPARQIFSHVEQHSKFGMAPVKK